MTHYAQDGQRPYGCEERESAGRPCVVQDRDRSYLLNQAVDNYLDLQQYHIELIEKGIRQADAGELVDHSEVEKMVAKLRRRK